MSTHRFCDGFLRRDFLRIGALTGVGLNLPGYLRLAQAGEIAPSSRGRSAIFIRLGGGPSHMDTFDLKPDAPDTHRGEFKPIKTNAPGVEICEHLPKLAQCADKFAIIRGVSHTLGAHRLGTDYLTTGNRPLPSLSFPCYGSVVAHEMSSDPDLPPFVAVPNQDFDATGYLGVEYGPFNTGSTPKPGRAIELRGLSLRDGVTLADVDRRYDMLRKFDTAFGPAAKQDKLLAGLDEFSQRAYAMLRSDRAREAFDLSKESPAITQMFNDSGFAQSCLLASRLVESGVRFVTVNYGGWDTHSDNFTRLKTRNLPELDAGLAGLFNALAAKGLLDSTTVFATGEFGRTPKVNGRAGRDHYPRAMFCLMAGGGVQGGRVVGASDAKGEGPLHDAISPDDVAASFYHSMGINPAKEFHTPSGRPVMIVRYGTVLKDLFA
ncbi:MAG: DUF1501 domain-containing protein [Planctomycetes bacterium]|nr:DUF1501 domain-containing protein [Planctomycetota bacterium]